MSRTLPGVSQTNLGLRAGTGRTSYLEKNTKFLEKALPEHYDDLFHTQVVFGAAAGSQPHSCLVPLVKLVVNILVGDKSRLHNTTR